MVNIYSLAWNIQWLLSFSTDNSGRNIKFNLPQWNACYEIKTETRKQTDGHSIINHLATMLKRFLKITGWRQENTKEKKNPDIQNHSCTSIHTLRMKKHKKLKLAQNIRLTFLFRLMLNSMKPHLSYESISSCIWLFKCTWGIYKLTFENGH